MTVDLTAQSEHMHPGMLDHGDTEQAPRPDAGESRASPATSAIRDHPLWVLCFTMLVSVGVVFVALNLGSLGWSALALVFAALIGAVGSVIAISDLGESWGIAGEGAVWWKRWLSFGLLGGATVLVGVGFATGMRVPAVLGLLAGLFGAGLLDYQIDKQSVPLGRFLVLPGVVVLAGGIMLATTGKQVFPDTSLYLSARLVGTVMILAGLALAKMGLPSYDLWQRNLVGLLARLVMLAATILGMRILFYWPTEVTGIFEVLLAFILTMIALAILVEYLIRLRMDSTGPKFILAGAVVFAVVGAWLLQVTVGRPWSDHADNVVLFLVAVPIFLLGAFYVLRGEGGFAVVLIGFALLWTLHDRAGMVQTLDPDRSLVIGIGDSYMSGQGASRFYAGNNSIGGLLDNSSGSDCRRSPDALPEQLAAVLSAKDGGDEFAAYNLACSGARIAHIATTPKHGHGDEAPVGEEVLPIPGAMTQLDELTALLAADPTVGERIDHVLVSIGGNDVQFATVIQACLLPSDCSELARQFRQEIDLDLQNALEIVYAEVAEKVGSSVPVTVIPYPEFLDEKTTCDIPINDSERDMVLGFQRALNFRIRQAVDRVAVDHPNVRLFAGGEHVYFGTAESEGRMVCDAIPGANFLHLTPHAGLSGALPSNWVQGSMHPRPDGHQRTAERLDEWMANELLGYELQPAADEASTLPDIVDTVDAQTPSDWITRNALESARFIVPGLVLIFLSGMLAALSAFYTFGADLADRHWARSLFPKWSVEDEGLEQTQ